jgi:succinate dehydrogenase/fumarate reductase flavoprotein subunit
LHTYTVRMTAHPHTYTAHYSTHTRTHTHTGRTPIPGLLAAGSSAAVVAAGFVTPFDVIKTRLQVEGSVYKGMCI